jgi:tRNA dimethylallyltransferase
VGPTASGKSSLAHALARDLGDVEILSVDSMQVYRGMDIGTAKPTAAERAEITYHLLDVVDPAETFTVGDFQQAARAVLGEIAARGHRVLLVGGTGLYLKAVVDGLELPGRFPVVREQLDAELATVGAPVLHRRLEQLDPVAAARIEPSNGRRVVRALEVCCGSGRPFSSYGPGIDTYPDVDVDLVGLCRPRPELDRRITERYVGQLGAGFLGEVDALAARPGGLGATARQALGYRELLAHLDGQLSLEEAVEVAGRRTRRFARRQERWFRRDPRIRWQAVDGQATGGGLVAVRARLSKDWSACG